MIKDRLFINDRPMPERLIGKFVVSDLGRPLGDQFLETLPNGATHTILKFNPNSVGSNTQAYTVPAGHYFMMGTTEITLSIVDFRELDLFQLTI